MTRPRATPLACRYRTRVGAFTLDTREPRRSEQNLMKALNTWRDELMSSGANLQMSALEKVYSDRVYTHYQYQVPPEMRKLVAKQREIKDKISQEIDEFRNKEEAEKEKVSCDLTVRAL